MNVLRRYLLPGFIFQSVVIAGGYGTGRELAEFFLSRGPLGGLLAMALAAAVWSVVCAVSFEFARVFRAFDYRTFFQRLLGPVWPAFEVLYLALMMIVLAVIAASAGSILQETFGLPYLAGVTGIMVLVGVLVFGGNETIEKALAGWSVVLYAVYAVFFVWCVTRFGPDIQASLNSGIVEGSWVRGGFEYAGYNLGVLPAVLISIRHHESRKDTLVSGLLTGPIAMIPALLFFVAIAGEYPAILGETVPVNHMLELLESRTFQIVFQVMLFGTLVETGAGFIHSVNERIASKYREAGRRLGAANRALFAVLILTAGAAIAQVGLTELIAKGYGWLTYGYLTLYVAPVLTWGIVLLRREGRAT